MTTTKTKTLIACFPTFAPARDAVRSLLRDGVDPACLGLLSADGPKARALLEDGPGNPLEAAAVGSMVGGTAFGLAAVALTTAPFGVLAVGPLVALLGGATAGAGAGGLIGALVGLGIPENEAVLRLDELRDGGMLLTLPVVDSETERRLRDQLDGLGAQQLFTV